MSPRQLRLAVVRSRLDEMRALLGDLDRLGDVTADRLREDRFVRHVAERVLSALVDLAVGVNSHVLATHRGLVPSDAAGTFAEAAAVGLIDADLARRLRGSVGLRNAIIHEYADVDLSLVAAAVPMARREYGAYVRAVARWLTSRDDG